MRFYGYKKVAVLFMVVLLCASMSACAVSPKTDSLVNEIIHETPGSTSDISVPQDTNTITLGTIQHQPQGVDVQTLTAPPLFNYSGGEFSLPYQVTATGNMKDVGFLLFLDGEPLTYKIDSTDSPYQYCHSFHYEDEAVVNSFTFLFTPNKGAMGNKSLLTVVGLTNPDFKPDMVETSGYGSNVSYTTFDMVLNFAADAPEDSSIEKKFPTINITDQFLQSEDVLSGELLARSWIQGGPFVPTDLEQASRQIITYDNEEAMDNYNAKQQGETALCHYMVGVPGTRYKITFFLDHIPVRDAEDNGTFSVTLQKSMVHKINFSIASSLLGNDGKTFYAIAVPLNAVDFPNAIVYLDKTFPVLIYSQNKGA